MARINRNKEVDIDAMIKLIAEAGVTYYMIEKALKIGKGMVSRGLKEGTARPLPIKWELPIIKYLKKKIAEKVDIQIQTAEVLQELGFKQPETATDLIEEENIIKEDWFIKLQEG